MKERTDGSSSRRANRECLKRNSTIGSTVIPNGSEWTVRTLLAHGADPDKKNINGVSPIDLARMIGGEDLMAAVNQDKKSES